MNRYKDISTKNTPVNKITKSVMVNVLYPEIPLSESDIYVITTRGDRFDLLALKFYGNSNYWWIISIANEALLQNSLFPSPGTQLRIPKNPQSVLESYNSLNRI